MKDWTDLAFFITLGTSFQASKGVKLKFCFFCLKVESEFLGKRSLDYNSFRLCAQDILAKRNQKPEVRKAQREQAIRAAKEAKKTTSKVTMALQSTNCLFLIVLGFLASFILGTGK